jgi:TolB protein
MKRLTASALALILASAALAQGKEDDVHRVFFDTLRTGDVKPLPVGIEDIDYTGTNYITAEDSALLRYCTGIIRFDVDFYADFELVQVDSFYMKVYEIMELDLMGWERLGATFVVKTEAEFPGEHIRLSYRIFDTGSKREIYKGRLEDDRGRWREMSHDLANDIVKALTGDQGPFRSKIVYARRLGKSKEIYLSDFDGANERQITRNGSINISPVISPDGRTVYFTSFLKGDPQLFRADVLGGKSEQVASFPGLIAAPAVSPDGTRIACVMTKDGNSELYILDLNGKVVKRLTTHTAIETSPSWSPDSRFVCFASDRTGSPQVYIVDTSGANTHRVTNQGKYNDSPIWSKRGDRITFVSRTQSGRFDLASIDTSGTDYRILTELGMNENPHFCDDGKHIVFASTRLGPSDIFVMDITGRNQRRITRSGDCSNPVWGPIPK